MSGWWLVILAIGAYLLGSVPFGLLIGLARGVDIRAAGSGNIGATNVGRVLGKPLGVLVFVLDMGKGLAPTLVAGALIGGLGGEHTLTTPQYAVWFGVGCAALIGHVFPVFLRFRGGKGVASALGVVLGLYPYFTWPGVVAFVIWTAVVKLSGYVSLGSITAAVLFPPAYWLLGLALHWPLRAQWPLSLIAVAMVALVLLRHRPNIHRLLSGTEPRRRSRPRDARPTGT